MPDKPLAVATYAAGASLAAIALVYVFGPTYLFDNADNTKVGNKAVGLVNPANDCFINSILQATAGLPDLRKYLIRELHRRELDGAEVYAVTEEDLDNEASGKGPKVVKLEGLRKGLVTKALKEILDKLNERPIHRKTISAGEFIKALEIALRTYISRNQQDAQEFMQVVLERICDEYHAGRKARLRHKRLSIDALGVTGTEETSPTEPDSDLPAEVEALSLNAKADDPPTTTVQAPTPDHDDTESETADDEGFPLEGKFESIIVCETCKFSPKPSVSTFVTLTLNVPESNSTTLNQCFDGMLKVEKIDDYKCDRCRLTDALTLKNKELLRSKDEADRRALEEDITKIQHAIDMDPEQPPEDAHLPHSKTAPKRRIQRHMRIASFPKILAIHLSRSLYSASFSTKNDAKVSFSEILPLGGLLEQRKYRLLAAVMHKGGHHNGHYETFRRQMTSAQPFSSSVTLGSEGVYSAQSSPHLAAVNSSRLSTVSTLRPSTPVSGGKRNSLVLGKSPRLSALIDEDVASTPRSTSPSRTSISLSSPKKTDAANASAGPNAADLAKMQKRQRKKESKWWRISDEKVKECSTKDVLGYQREVYLLFYEEVKDDS